MKQFGTRNIQRGKKPFMKQALKGPAAQRGKGAVPKGCASGSKLIVETRRRRVSEG